MLDEDKTTDWLTQSHHEIARHAEKVGSLGASAKAIAANLANYGRLRGDYPHDASDFARCEALLDAVPGLRSRLGSMVEVNAYWAALAPQWNAIREAEDQTAAIRAIVAPIESDDPDYFQIGVGVSMRAGDVPAQGAAERKSGPHMKETDADREVREGAERVAAAELRQFVERFERLEAEKKDISDQQKEVMAEAKGRGYDTKAMRKLIALRKRDPQEVAQEEAVLEMYRTALEG